MSDESPILPGRAPFGKIISLTEARNGIDKSLNGLETVIKTFVSVFDSELDKDRKSLGIYYHAGDASRVYQGIFIIGNSKRDKQAQISLCIGDMYISLLGGMPVISLGLDYGRKDINFQPLDYERLKHGIGNEKFVYAAAFPLFLRECGAEIYPKNLVKMISTGTEVETTLQEIDIKITDEKLRGLATDLRKRMEQ